MPKYCDLKHEHYAHCYGKKPCDCGMCEENISVFDTITKKTFIFKNHKDKENFFDTWDKLVIRVE